MVHRPTRLFGTSSSASGSWDNPFDTQLINHYAVEVVGESGDLKRYELNRDDGKIVTLKYDLNASREDYENVKGLIIETDIVGYTSYSDGEILEIAQQLIEDHGDYHLIGNNCKFWATKMFNRVANDEGRLGVLVGELYGWFQRIIFEDE
ncbi:hypothetical protein BDV40DRAFT_299974 [Aspergillus tamarii]|uniref:Uncharacterized protein n=1 Tax=Aspergillus tamarii TaxID=41984 RepID=A0A5N6UWT3_ASPTM|nr:hypothetical protein BDV40DRAFT_299974 [Aspergillus tamarii]